MIEWKVDFGTYERANTMPLDRAKIEALRRIAEELKKLNETLDGLIFLSGGITKEKSLKVTRI